MVTRHRTKIYKTKTQRRKLKRCATRTPPTNGVNSGDLEEKAVPVYYKTLAVLLIYTVKSGKGLVSSRGKKTPT